MEVVQSNGAKLIVVLGHQSCGDVSAAIAGKDNGHNLNILLAQINPTIEKAGKKEIH